MVDFNDKSDYSKVRTNLYELLPDVYKSETNKSVFENLFNRYLTKSDVDKIAGYIGVGNPSAVASRQIHEQTVHRQGFQLQPILNQKIGTIEHMASWSDLSSELTRLGVNPEFFNQWGEVLKFNWVPPVDMDKLINFQDYYWYDTETTNSKPEYLTIRSRCNTAIANVNLWTSIITEFGSSFSINQILPSDAESIFYPILGIDINTNTITIANNITDNIKSGDLFDITHSTINNGTYTIASISGFDRNTNTTSFMVEPNELVGSEVESGEMHIRRFNKLVVLGDYGRLFDPGFLFAVKGSNNTELNDKFWLVEKSIYDFDTTKTTIWINDTITDNTPGGQIVIDSLLNFYLLERDCQCAGTAGWDTLQWDDNIEAPLWGASISAGQSNHETLLQEISNPTPPPSTGNDTELWYDTDADKLYQYLDNIWTVIWNRFSLILEKTKGFALWDLTDACGIEEHNVASDQWSNANHWLHKNDIQNFSLAKQAQIPIIEYQWDLELNEWTVLNYLWKYRQNQYTDWESVDFTPPLIELNSLSWWETDVSNGSVIILDDRYGDLTDYFIKGKIFRGEGTTDEYEVVSSSYGNSTAGEPYKTYVEITVTISSTELISGNFSTLSESPTPLFPYHTEHNDDSWRGYEQHWLFDGIYNTLPAVHQVLNPFVSIDLNQIPTIHSSGEYDYTISYFAQESNILSPTPVSVIMLAGYNDMLSGTTRPLTRKSLAGFNDVIVYINNIRQYGIFEEITEIESSTGYKFVSGIRFFENHYVNKFDTVRIEVGESAITDIGWYSVTVQVLRDGSLANEQLSLIDNRLTGQVKTRQNIYPTFDIYNIDGTEANDTNSIFGFDVSADADVNFAVGLRIHHEDFKNFFFDQFLIAEDGGKLFAYRDYSNRTHEYWFNPSTQKVNFWVDDGLQWSTKTLMAEFYREAEVSDDEPTSFEGLYWFNTLSDKLFLHVNLVWVEITDVIVSTTDETLQTIWKKGLNNETYVPEKVDWDRRNYEIYEEQRVLFVDINFTEIQINNPQWSDEEVLLEANRLWYIDQQNHLSTNGRWIGDWEVPDPLFFNNQHENRKIYNTRELLTHFNTIIDEQPKIPGFNGPASSMFHYIPINDVNYGVGGKIKEYNYSYDTLFSSLFVNNVTPRSLIEFAHDQYESLLNGLAESYTSDLPDYLVTVNFDTLTNLSKHISDAVIRVHELNDNLQLLYGDSTTFIDNIGGVDTGIRNWIITLPYLEIIHRIFPEHVYDPKAGINEVVHHDTHRRNYNLSNSITENIISTVIETDDPRALSSSNEIIDTFGRLSTTSAPPNYISEFSTSFNTTIVNREGVYWYDISNDQRVFYRLELAGTGINPPTSEFLNGSLWMDTTLGVEVLRMKQYDYSTRRDEWLVVDGLSIGDGRLHNGSDPNDLTTASVSVWKPISLDYMLGEVILSAEELVYQNAPEFNNPKYDISEPRNQYPATYLQYLEEAFLDYIAQNETVGAYVNSKFTVTDPFTWNYKNSIPGSGYNIVLSDSSTNSFAIRTDVSQLISSTQYIKNSVVNDGTWIVSVFPNTNTLNVVYDPSTDLTTVFVEGQVQDTTEGVMYVGLLPSSINDGSESGGYWQDLYNKLYNTSFPHLEPWILQGYVNKPIWWDEEYLNDVPLKWGDRRWKYKHGFEVINTNLQNDSFDIVGDFREAFTPNTDFTIDRFDCNIMPPQDCNRTFVVNKYVDIGGITTGEFGTIKVATDVVDLFPSDLQILVSDNAGNIKGLFTIIYSIFTGPPENQTLIYVEEPISDGTNFDVISGATYNHLTNLTTIIVTDDVQNTFPANSRITHYPLSIQSVGYGMWENIRRGVVPNGRDRPLLYTNAPLPTYNYFSVNIDNATVSGGLGSGYHSDAVLPPFWDHTVHYTTAIDLFDRSIRSVFYLFTTEIITPGADYKFGDAGPIEFDWRKSSQFLYDQMTISFRLDPVKYVSHTFGPDFIEVGGLEINDQTERTMSHTRANWHGEIIDEQIYKVNGTDQWYVNFNRYSGYDLSFSDFRRLWVNWIAPLTYQFSSFIDTSSLEVDHRYVVIGDVDHKIESKIVKGVNEFWFDVFDISVLKIPIQTSAYNNQNEWQFEINTNAVKSRDINCYHVHNYQFRMDSATDTLNFYSWDILAVDVFRNSFIIEGNQSLIFTDQLTFALTDSTGNNGKYTVSSSIFNSVTNDTTIAVYELITSYDVNGIITANYRTHPWATGNVVYLSSTKFLPTPLQSENVNGLLTYFAIVVDDTHIKLALTERDAQAGIAINVLNDGTGIHHVGQLLNVFKALNGEYTTLNWRHYALDYDNSFRFVTPFVINGVQNIVDIVDGYDGYSKNQGWVINANMELVDPITQTSVTWQTEVEKFINNIFQLQLARVQINDRYTISADVQTNMWTFIDFNKLFITGDSIRLISNNSVFPSPFDRGSYYYVIRLSQTEFQLAASKNDAINGVPIVITSDTGVGDLSLYQSVVKTAQLDKFEVNPARTSMWFNQPQGIVSNVLTGPSDDIFTSQLVFDQEGNRIPSNRIKVFRQDRQTYIDVNVNNSNYVGGYHIFTDNYEHALVFADYTADQELIYDTFLGLNLTKFEMLYERQTTFTQRPNVGGFYLETFFNQGASLRPNIEANIDNLRMAYDTYTVPESSSLVKESRKSLGYEGNREYLDSLFMNNKSQFIFWRGQIQQKGSTNAMNAFINSRRFIDASLDEFWAFKLGEFGSAYEKEYPELYITTDDVKGSEVKFQFVAETDVCYAGYESNTYDVGCGYDFPLTGSSVRGLNPEFTPVTLTDTERWFNQPDQLDILRNNGSNMYFELSVKGKMEISIGPISPETPQEGDSWIDTNPSNSNDFEFNTWTGTIWMVIDGWTNAEDPAIRHNFKSDTTRVFAEQDVNVIGIGPTTRHLWRITNTSTVYILDQIAIYNETSVGWEQLVFIPYDSISDADAAGYNPQDGDYIFNSPDKLVYQYIGDDAVWNVVNYYKTSSNLPSGTPTNIITVVNPQLVQLPIEYITLSESITLFENGKNEITFIDVLTNDFKSTQLNILTDVTLLKELSISMRVRQFFERTHYENINSNIIQLFSNNLLDTDKITIWGLTANEDAQNPAKFLDKKSETYITPIQMWDPARGDHQYNAIFNVDLQNESDPALYNTSLVLPRFVIEDDPVNHIGPWTNEKVGITWMDLHDTEYLQYYDTKIYSATADRMFNWGLQTDWSSVTLYEWVHSDVLPDQWNDLAISQESDQTIPEGERKSGTVNKTWFKKVGSEWEVYRNLYDVFDTAIEGVYFPGLNQYEFTLENIQYQPDVSSFEYPNIMSVYVNGVLRDENVVIPINGKYYIDVHEQDRVTFIEFVLTDEELLVQGVQLELFAEEYQYVVKQLHDRLGVEKLEYYFWVTKKNTRPTGKNRSMTLTDSENELNKITIPYMFFQNLVAEEDVTIDNITYHLPARFTQNIIRGLSGLVDSDRRYTIKYTRDFTLRDDLEVGKTPLDMKNYHEEWQLFREQQQYNIAAGLWNKLTESMIGYTLTDKSIRVPSYERELYDTQYKTSVQYGLRSGQTFTNGQLALITVLTYLEDPEKNFTPIDINVFFKRHSFDTPDNIHESMNYIYNTFPYEHVNSIYFNALHDAFSFRTKYPDIFKTSMVSLYGVKPFQIQGIFDD